MAQVLAYNDTRPDIRMLRTQSSSSDTFGNTTSSQPPSQTSRIMQMPRTHFNGQQAAAGYRGTSTPTSPYAFKSPPQLARPNPTFSTFTSPHQPSEHVFTTARQGHLVQSPSVSTTSSATSSSWGHDINGKDDFAQHPPLPNLSNRPFSTAEFAAPVPEQTIPAADRYRKPQRRLATDTSLTLSNAMANMELKAKVNHAADLPDENLTARAMSPEPQDAATIYKGHPGNIEAATTIRVAPASPHSKGRNAPTYSDPLSSPQRGASSHAQDSRSATSSIPYTRQNVDRSSGAPTASFDTKRSFSPSPLSRPSGANDIGRSSTDTTNTLNSGRPFSPAAASMAALNNKDPSKSMKSRLRRAFSFGSSAELRRAAGEPETTADRTRPRQEYYTTGLNDEEDVIARKQTASGLGNSIYSGQGRRFTGSVDNLSISSTASSASLMLRKMGQSVKKGGRSVKGIFRPKSVIGVPAADSPLKPSVGPVSMINVEAERERVNVNADPHEHAGGGTGFPHLERNSVDADIAMRSQRYEPPYEDVAPRRSLATGDIERSEVLSAVKRGILKRPATPTSPLPVHDRPYSPYANRAASPSPSITNSNRRTGMRRAESPARGASGFDYFGRQQNNSRSLPATPRGTNSARNITFSPRISFHDVWSSTEYDRRGEVATCNRLTPLLAQQIKEELNTFKMEMEVHELSKPHTHFF